VEDATWENKQVLRFLGLKLLEDKQIWARRTVMSLFPRQSGYCDGLYSFP
jgi:hypothetical protein